MDQETRRKLAAAIFPEQYAAVFCEDCWHEKFFHSKKDGCRVTTQYPLTCPCYRVYER